MAKRSSTASRTRCGSSTFMRFVTSFWFSRSCMARLWRSAPRRHRLRLFPRVVREARKARYFRAERIEGETACKPGSVTPAGRTRPGRQPFLWAPGCPGALATYPQASAEPASIACLFGVAPDGGCRVSPLGCWAEDSSLWPCSSRRRARGLPCIPLCGARTFLYAPQKPTPSGCLADSRMRFYPASTQEYAFAMRRRLYFLLPDVESARHTADDLLLARLEDRHMHFLARRGTDLGELHEASYLFKTDLLHGAGIGLMLGGIGGLILGAVIVAYP